MMTSQDHRDCAVPAPVAAAPGEIPAATEPPSYQAQRRLAYERPHVEPWSGPYEEQGEPEVTAHFRANILVRDGDLFAYEASWRTGGSGSLLRRQHGFINATEARTAAKWTLEHLEGKLATE